MKKKLFAGVLASATVLGVCMAGGAALAAEQDTVTTEAGIGFTDYVPGGTGDLAIKWAPGSFDFGTTNTVNTSATEYNEDSGAKKHVVIEEKRKGATDKWELSVGLSDIKSGSAQLTGATLEFGAKVKAYQGTATPESPGSIVDVLGQTATVTDTTQVLNQGVANQPVMKDDGNGTRSYEGTTALEMDEIKMSVPAGVAKAGRQYSGTVTWSLDDTL